MSTSKPSPFSLCFGFCSSLSYLAQGATCRSAANPRLRLRLRQPRVLCGLFTSYVEELYECVSSCHIAAVGGCLAEKFYKNARLQSLRLLFSGKILLSPSSPSPPLPLSLALWLPGAPFALFWVGCSVSGFVFVCVSLSVLPLGAASGFVFLLSVSVCLGSSVCSVLGSGLSPGRFLFRVLSSAKHRTALWCLVSRPSGAEPRRSASAMSCGEEPRRSAVSLLCRCASFILQRCGASSVSSCHIAGSRGCLAGKFYKGARLQSLRLLFSGKILLSSSSPSTPLPLSLALWLPGAPFALFWVGCSGFVFVCESLSVLLLGFLFRVLSSTENRPALWCLASRASAMLCGAEPRRSAVSLRCGASSVSSCHISYALRCASVSCSAVVPRRSVLSLWAPGRLSG